MGKEGQLIVAIDNNNDSENVILKDSFEDALLWKSTGGSDSDYTVELETTASKVASGTKSLHLKTATTTPAINDWVLAYAYRGTPNNPNNVRCNMQFMTLEDPTTIELEVQFYVYKQKNGANSTASARMRWSGGDNEWQVYNGSSWVALEGLTPLLTSTTVEQWHRIELIIDAEDNKFLALRVDDALATNIKNISVQSANASGQSFVFLGIQLTTLANAQKECWIDDFTAKSRKD